MTTSKVEFEPFQKIHRLKRNCVITEKIDGTNAQIYLPEDDGPMLVGSRNRWITPDDDNYGFARWAFENEEELRKLGPGRHFGEWWGSGIQRRYGLDKKIFSLFNTSRWNSETLPKCVSVVPVLYTGEFASDTVDDCLTLLKHGGSLASPGFMNPEGVVVFLTASRSFFKVTLDGDAHKGQ